MIAVEGARRLGFSIERAKGPTEEEPESDDWMDVEIEEQRKFARKNELTYD
jgi:hypothetical protein